MVKNILSEKMIERELNLLAFHLGMVKDLTCKDLKLHLDYDINSDKCKMIFTYKNKSTVNLIEPNSLDLSLDRFSKEILYPNFGRFSDYFGYATWD